VKRKTSKPAAANRRTKTVWGAFVGAMAVMTGVLTLADGGPRAGFAATAIEPIHGQAGGDPVTPPTAPLDRARWSGIVIHHSALPAGDPDSMHRLHQGYGYQGLGYHFLIGNGHGMDDGAVHVGYRWAQQLPGAHSLGPDSEQHNQHSIGICLIGNGDRREFTPAQVAKLIDLVQGLQRELNIPASAVRLHRDLAPGQTSPGRFFPAAALQEQLVP
jgi:hypothetical protein